MCLYISIFKHGLTVGEGSICIHKAIQERKTLLEQMTMQNTNNILLPAVADLHMGHI